MYFLLIFTLLALGSKHTFAQEPNAPGINGGIPPRPGGRPQLVQRFPNRLTPTVINNVVQQAQAQANRNVRPPPPPPQGPPPPPQNRRPQQLINAFNQPRPGATNAVQAVTIEQATRDLIAITGSNAPTLSGFAVVPNCTVVSDQPLVSIPPPSPPGTPPFNLFTSQNQTVLNQLRTQNPCVFNKFRSLNGHCNNPVFPWRGKDNAAFLRLMTPNYSDQVSAIRKSVVGGNPLPSARLVSTSIVGYKVAVQPFWTHLVMQWGQFLDHDLTSTPQTVLSTNCCGVAVPDPECLAISVPADDPYYKNFKQTCMEFIRSIPATRPDCTLGPREQQSQLSAFIDGGQIYGTSEDVAKSLRTFSNGLLKSQTMPGGYTVLPGHSSSFCVDGTAQQACFLAGDGRVNEQGGLMSLHTIFMRFHNLMANRIRALNPTWNDERLFQEARTIVIAALQQITYKEWLPILLGNTGITQNRLNLTSAGTRFRGYNMYLNPTISNEFSTAAFRVGHTMVNSLMNRVNAAGVNASVMRVESTFFKAQTVYANNAADEIAIGLSRDLGKGIDNNVVEDLHDHLFFTGPGSPGLDLVSLNVQRGRDHGLRSYNDYREFCRMGRLTSFSELNQPNLFAAGVGTQLQKIYAHVDDIDLFIGGIIEMPVFDGAMGPLFGCIFADQFRRLRNGDRFWFENDLGQFNVLTNPQLEEVRKLSMARILCDTTITTQVQPLVFLSIGGPIDPTNLLTSCTNLARIPQMNLEPWREGTQGPQRPPPPPRGGGGGGAPPPPPPPPPRG